MVPSTGDAIVTPAIDDGPSFALCCSRSNGEEGLRRNRAYFLIERRGNAGRKRGSHRGVRLSPPEIRFKPA